MTWLFLLTYLALSILSLELLSKSGWKKLRLLKSWFIAGSLLLLFLLLLALKDMGLPPFISATLFLSFLAAAGKIKVDYRQRGFTPKDLLILREAGSMAGALSSKAMQPLLLGLAFSLLLTLAVSAAAALPQLPRGTGMLLFALYLLLLWTGGPRLQRKTTVYETGCLLYFFLYLHDPVLLEEADKKPEQEALLPGSFSPSSLEPQELPHVLVIQSESFFDPTLLGSSFFSKDPLENFHRLEQEGKPFTLATRAYGGGTVHTELEVLTALSTAFFPKDTTVFSRYLKKPMPSLGSIFSRNGYRTALYHPYQRWYYNRQEAYRLMGFDAFHSRTAFPASPGYLPDSLLQEALLQELEQSQEPLFLFAVTMQNHAPYRTSAFSHGVAYQGAAGSPDSKEQFENYLQGLRETDIWLGRLTEALRAGKRDTLLFFYGDHLPVINQDPGFYQGIQWDLSPFDSHPWHYALSKTPALLWHRGMKPEGMEKPVLDAIFAPGMLLKEAGVQAPEYFQRLEQLRRDNSLEAFFREFLVADGLFFTSDMAEYIKISHELAEISQDIYYHPDPSWTRVAPDFRIY